MRDLWAQDMADSGNTLFAALEEYGLLASIDAGKTYQHVAIDGVSSQSRVQSLLPPRIVDAPVDFGFPAFV